jgi:hypothetical protein
MPMPVATPAKAVAAPAPLLSASGAASLLVVL